MARKTNITSRSSKGSRVNILETRDFPGTYSYPKPQQIPRGAAQKSLNMLSRGTWVETRGGYHPIGTEVTGSGKVLGIFTGHKWDGSEILYRATLDGKLSYFDGSVWQEVGGAGANILAGAIATQENVYIDEYFSPAGAQLWVSSPSTDLIKIMTANPASYLSQYDASKNFKGRMRIIQNSMWLWHYILSSTFTGSQATKATVQRSYIDSQDYQTQTDNNTALGTSISGNTISGTLTKNSIANATVFGVVITDSDTPNETFTDDYLGNLVGSLGGTGSIDYCTGKFTITPKNAPVSPSLSATYSYEDSTAGGIADFTKSGTRAAGQGVAWIQNNGGDILGVNPYNGSEYILHQRNAYIVTPSSDDTGATNVIYRQNLSLASERGSVATADGVYYVDTTLASRPFIALLSYDPISAQVLPIDLSSEILDLSMYVFDQCCAYQWGDFIVFECRTPDSAVNNRMVTFNYKLSEMPSVTARSQKKSRIFDTQDFFGNCFATYQGQLVAGDSLSNNVYKLFDGFDDDNGIPNCYWIGNVDDHQVPGLKQTKKLWVEGYIGTNQTVDVYVQLDANTSYKVGTISGQGVYVDQGQSVTIGSLQVGVYPIGGPNDQGVGYHYLIEIIVNTSKYKYFTISFFPTGIGYFSFQMYANYDIRLNTDKLPNKYRAIPTHTNYTIAGGGTAGQTGGGKTANVFYTETPTGLINGVNTVYTVKNTLNIVVNFEINGEEINSSMYTFSGNQIIFKSALDSSLSGLPFEIVYG